MDMWNIDWAGLFVPSGSLVEIVLRGSILFLALFFILRLLPRRQIGSLGVSDLLVIVIIADAAQNGLSGEYKSITEGVVLVATILIWNFIIDTLDYRFPSLGINASPPRLVVSHGRMVRKNMREEELSEEQLMSHLRQQGVEDLQLVSKAYVEGDGRISVIKSRGA
ncbi:MAG TPA: YetF domain-containing protein [Burkholderiales bacterium]|nr:YetF domain-containing protein [Burkholderiales bacterium]